MRVTYDPIRIQTFLTQKLGKDLQRFCFVLQYKVNPALAFEFLAGDSFIDKSIDLIQKALAAEQLGEVVFELVKYWLDDVHGSPKVLTRMQLNKDLAVFQQELVDVGQREKFDQVCVLLKRIEPDEPLPESEPVSPLQYNAKVIHDLVMAAFTAEELWRFCRYHSAFEPMIDQVGVDYSLASITDRLITHCEKKMLFPELLAEIRKINPRQYDRFSNHFHKAVQDS
jgi:hypothetical protein